MTEGGWHKGHTVQVCIESVIGAIPALAKICNNMILNVYSLFPEIVDIGLVAKIK